ncbi:MAG: hypothetical protein ACK56I_22240, partial [bacterium]
MIRGQANDLRDRVCIESHHRAALIAQSTCGEHQSHASQSGRAHALVASELLFARIKALQGRHQNVLH